MMHGKAIVFGPYMHNFQEIADTFVANGAAIQVHNERELEDTPSVRGMVRAIPHLVTIIEERGE